MTEAPDLTRPQRGHFRLASGSAIAAVWFALNFFIAFPAGILYLTGTDLWPPPSGFTRILGVAIILGAHAALTQPVLAFIVEGRGTHAPLAPPRHMVLSGLYTRVRNPMYLTYVAIAIGEAVLYRSTALVAYAAFLFGLAHWYVVRFEEKALRERFGAEYDDYCARVGRWLPRRRRPA